MAIAANQGGMLSDSDIKMEVQRGDQGDLMIRDCDDDCITPVGYDVRAGDHVFSLKKRRVISLNNSEFEIEPGDTVFVSSYESFQLSRRIGGIGTSRLGPTLDGVFSVTLPLDPTWNGKLLIVMTNVGRKSYKISYKQPLMTVCFLQMQNASDKEIKRERWDNDNIMQKFREMEAATIPQRRKLLLWDLGVHAVFVTVPCILFSKGLIPNFSNVVTLAVAASAIYFSRFRRIWLD